MKLLLALLFLASCSHTIVTKEPDVVVEVGEVEIETPRPVESHVKVVVSSLRGFTEGQAERFRKIAANVEELINSKTFADAVVGFTHDGKKQFVDTADTNEEVLSKIRSKDWVLEYRLEWLWHKSTVGYTYPNVSWIVINSRQWPNLDDAEVAGNIIHEYGGHKLGGYGHAQQWNKTRDYSVPYGLGYLGEELYRKIFMR